MSKPIAQLRRVVHVRGYYDPPRHSEMVDLTLACGHVETRLASRFKYAPQRVKCPDCTKGVCPGE